MMDGPESELAERRRDWVAAALIVGTGILFFFDVLFSSKNFFFRDILNFHYPLRKVLIEAWSRGEFPVWNPFIYFGQPMLANPNYMAFYPTNLLHLVAPFDYAFKLHFVSHPILGGLGAYALQRRLGLPFVPALAGSLGYEFSGPVLSFLNLYNLVPAVALMPWTGWAFWGALRGARLRRTLAFAGFLALQVIALEPLIFMCNALLLAALAIFHAGDRGWEMRAVKDIVWVGAAGGLCAVGFSAIQVLPTLELLPLSARAAGLSYETATGWSTHPMDLLSAFIPNFYGSPYKLGNSAGWGEAFHELRPPYLVSSFLGIVPLFFACLSFLSPRKRLRRVVVVTAAVAVVLALGKYSPVYPFLYRHVPMFDLGRYPSKYFLLVSLLVAILAGIGFDAAFDSKADGKAGRRRQLACGFAGFLGMCLLCTGLIFAIQPAHLEYFLRGQTPVAFSAQKDYAGVSAGLARSVVASGAFLLVAAAVAFFGTSSRRSLLAGAPGLLVVLELCPPNLGLSPLMSAADFSYVPELSGLISANAPSERFRVVTPNVLFPAPTELSLSAPNQSAAWLVLFYRRSGQSLDAIRSGIEYSLDRSVDHLNTAESDRLANTAWQLPLERRIALLGNLNTPLAMTVGDIPDLRATLLARIDTHSNLDYRLYRLAPYTPRAYFAGTAVKAASHEEALQTLVGLNGPLQSTVILESPTSGSSTGPASSGNAEITGYENNRVSCRVRSGGPGYLVLLDSFYPGWKARVDGRAVPILRANYAFRAVLLDAGDHIVEFSFEPISFYLGACVSLVTVVAAAAFCIFPLTLSVLGKSR